MKPPESLEIVVSYDVQQTAGITLVTYRKERVLDVHQDGMAQHVTKVSSKLELIHMSLSENIKYTKFVRKIIPENRVEILS